MESSPQGILPPRLAARPGVLERDANVAGMPGNRRGTLTAAPVSGHERPSRAQERYGRAPDARLPTGRLVGHRSGDPLVEVLLVLLVDLRRRLALQRDLEPLVHRIH